MATSATERKKEELSENAKKSPILERRGVPTLAPIKVEDGGQPIKAGRRRTPLAFTDPREPLSGDPLTDVPEVEFPAGWDPRSPTADVPRTPNDAAKAAAAASDGDTVVDRTPLGFPDPRSPP